MTIIPAIDIMDGKVVRLKKGKKDDVTVYSDNPIEVIEYFNDLGIRRVHIVDLDAAFTGEIKNNRKLIKKIAKEFDGEVEVGGGIRSEGSAREILDIADKIIVGTMPVKNPEEFDKLIKTFGDRVIVGVDVENGYVKISGWIEDAKIGYIDFLMSMRSKGVDEAIVTDIARDGTLDGINDEFYKVLAEKTGMGIIVSGGVRNIDDIERVKSLKRYGVVGVIIGRAFYERTLSLEEAIELQND